MMPSAQPLCSDCDKDAAFPAYVKETAPLIDDESDDEFDINAPDFKSKVLDYIKPYAARSCIIEKKD